MTTTEGKIHTNEAMVQRNRKSRLLSKEPSKKKKSMD
jgi:hypothetical protein